MLLRDWHWMIVKILYRFLLIYPSDLLLQVQADKINYNVLVSFHEDTIHILLLLFVVVVVMQFNFYFIFYVLLFNCRVHSWADKLGMELFHLGDFITRRKEVQEVCTIMCR